MKPYLLPLLLLLLACTGRPRHNARYHHTPVTKGDSLRKFNNLVKHLSRQTKILVFKDSTSKGAIVITPDWNAQVIACTVNEKEDAHHAAGYTQEDGEDHPNSGQFRQISVSKHSILLEKDSGNFTLQRRIRLIARRDIPNYLGGQTLHRSIQAIAFESENNIVNKGATAADSVFIQISGRFPATDDIRVLLPDKAAKRFNIFSPGKVTGVMFNNAANYFGYYDAEQEVLTIIQFTMPGGQVTYNGPAIDARNENALVLGSRSPFSKLKPGAGLQHFHRTIHLSGTPKRLEPVMKKIFGVTMKQLDATF
ncbi:hypothetical protein MKQ68_02675 [Chitinophaga horti]|uniref:DUF5117 domain-containing protein n=1 Tax=Chitinophaga horti TaxID=2920382 RepID=A0ABY6J2V9_9BACT|nr:DUF6786 family protein [Chitinophaga horti]UYQ93996.1 hypothetical protein MKQ68_02675 [Chitinophaga horti]